MENDRNIEKMMDIIGLHSIAINSKLTDAMQKIDLNAHGTVFIERDGMLVGALSDGDIRRAILKYGNIELTVDQVMNENPKYVLIGQESQVESVMKHNGINVVPIVDNLMHIKNIIINDGVVNTKCDIRHKIMENVPVVIMAGGKGTRLYPYTKILPKPLIPIGEIPIVERVMDSFNEYGISDFIMTVNYKKNMIQSYFSETDKAYTIEYVEEDKPLGTAGSLKLISRQFNQPIIVANCDSLIRTDYEEAFRYHTDSGNSITMVTSLKNDQIPYGVVYSKENGEIDYIEEKPMRSYLINTGMYIINPDMIDLIPDDVMFHMTHLVEKAMNNGHRVGMFPISEDSFLDMGEFAEMKRMEEKLNIQ